MAGRVRSRSAIRVVTGPDAPTWEKAPAGTPVEYDREEAARMLLTGGRGTRLPATGRCHDCGRAVSGERRFCGPCLAGH